MSFVITTDVFCDGDRCSLWQSHGGITGNRIKKREATKRSKDWGWTSKGRKHFCPLCNGNADHMSEGVFYKMGKQL